jgi:hypothetical protein
VLGNAVSKFEGTFGEIKLQAGHGGRLEGSSIGFQTINAAPDKEEKQSG